MRVKITIDTTSQVKKFCEIASSIDDKIVVKDASGFCVNAKSVLGVLYSLEFSELWLESDNDYYTQFKDFINGNSLIDNDSVVLKREN